MRLPERAADKLQHSLRKYFGLRPSFIACSRLQHSGKL
jgi:hypothetical protein